MRKKIKTNIMMRSVIAQDIVLEGNLSAKEATRIDGTVKGFVHSESTLVVGQSGKIEGNVHAESIYIAGEVHGDLVAGEKIEVSATGKIYGNIITKSLVIDESAIFQGKCEMNIVAPKVKNTPIEMQVEEKNEAEVKNEVKKK